MYPIRKTLLRIETIKNNNSSEILDIKLYTFDNLPNT
jgi:hypothetical protein